MLGEAEHELVADEQRLVIHALAQGRQRRITQLRGDAENITGRGPHVDHDG
jgi:hypothetical protein